MKIISWNTNGVPSCVKNGSFDPISRLRPDLICLQEVRTQQEPAVATGYAHYWNRGEIDGYSGTAILSKRKPRRVLYDFDGLYPDTEGRLLALELDELYVVNAYVPNSQKNLKRHAYRMRWDEALRGYACCLQEHKPVILCGDFNVAHTELDIYAENARQYSDSQGYVSDERSNFEALLELGFTDVYRHFYPTERSYTWWSNRLHKRGEDRGWRLDYFVISDELLPHVKSVRHLSDVTAQ